MSRAEQPQSVTIVAKRLVALQNDFQVSFANHFPLVFWQFHYHGQHIVSSRRLNGWPVTEG
jgi:hypothetical protein